MESAIAETRATTMTEPDNRDETARADALSLRVWKAGNPRGYNQLVERHQKPLFRFILRHTRDADEAKDVLQETLMRLYRSKDQLREDKNLRSWLFQTANRLCIDWYRKRKPDRVLSVDHQDPATRPLFEAFAPEGETPGGRFEETRLFGLIRDAIDQLPGRQRAIMLLRSCEDLSLGEIAERMDCSERTVGTTLFAARKKLMKLLKPLHDELCGSSRPATPVNGAE